MTNTITQLHHVNSVKLLSFWQGLGLAWFAISILLLVVSHLFFMLWLGNRGAKLKFGLTGIPGYLEMEYKKMCQQQGRSSQKIIMLRVIVFVNCLLAALIVVPIVIMN